MTSSFMFLIIFETDTQLSKVTCKEASLPIFCSRTTFYIYSFIVDGEGGIRRFHRMKTEWGLDKFIPLETFNHASNGYLLEDCCVFGAEVFVMKHNGKGECVMAMKNPLNNTYTWKIDNVSKRDEELVLSEAFVVGEHKW